MQSHRHLCDTIITESIHKHITPLFNHFYDLYLYSFELCYLTFSTAFRTCDFAKLTIKLTREILEIFTYKKRPRLRFDFT